MSSESQHIQQQSTPAAHIIMVLTGIAMISGFLVVLTSQLTAPFIAENQRVAIESAVNKVIPGSIIHREFILTNDGLKPPEKGIDGQSIYAGYDADGKLLGVAARASAQGYGGMIYLLYGYDPQCQCIRGIKVLKMAETPGLGDKIIRDPAFQANFDELDARLDPSHMALLNPIVTVKHGNKKEAWEVDAISGATISSKAVGKALNASAQSLLPKLLPVIGQLESAGK
ncbi:RnfABCDGE type electron transport complex subunit G [Thiolapillus sp.]